MQIKSLLVAFGLVAASTAAALPEAQPELEARAVSAPFKIRRFTPLAGFKESDPTTWSNNQYTNVNTANALFNYDGVTDDNVFLWTYDPALFRLRGSKTGTGGLAPRNQQSYGITVTPVMFGGAGEEVKVTIGPAPLYEVKFQTQRGGQPVSGWTGLAQIDSKVYLGKASDISQPVRFRAIGYTPPQ